MWSICQACYPALTWAFVKILLQPDQLRCKEERSKICGKFFQKTRGYFLYFKGHMFTLLHLLYSRSYYIHKSKKTENESQHSLIRAYF